MKKPVLLLTLIFAITFIMSSCTAKENLPAQSVKADFTAMADVKYNGKDTKCLVKNDKINGTEIIIKEPKSLEGFTINISNDKNNIEFNDLYCETENLPVLKNSYPSFINEVLKDISNSESVEIDKKKNVICGKLDNENYEVYIDPSTGFIKRITAPNLNLDITFSDQT